MLFSQIVFMQDQDDFAAAEQAYEAGGWDGLLDHLKQWDYGEDQDVRHESSAATTDSWFQGLSAQNNGYLITINFALGYVGLERVTREAGDRS